MKIRISSLNKIKSLKIGEILGGLKIKRGQDE